MKSNKRPIAARSLGWSAIGALQLHVEHASHRLQILISQVPGIMAWSVVALESKRDDTTADAILAEHSHANLGESPDLPAAVAKADAYATVWQRAREAAAACECEEIGAESKL